MGRAKDEMLEKEARQARREQYLIDHQGYSKCVECGEMFIAKEGSLICNDCWKVQMEKD